MLDCHCHCLPGVDDGAVDLDDGYATLCRLYALGFCCICATPHWLSPFFPEVTSEKLTTAWQTFTTDLSGRPALPGLTVRLGAENHIGIVSSKVFLAQVHPLEGPTLGWNAQGQFVVGDQSPGRWFLLELPEDRVPPEFETIVFALNRQGGRCVIAHPERTAALVGKRELLSRLIANGTLFQLDAEAFSPRFNFGNWWRGQSLLRRFPTACLVAGDDHGRQRPAPWSRVPKQRWPTFPDLDLATKDEGMFL